MESQIFHVTRCRMELYNFRVRRLLLYFILRIFLLLLPLCNHSHFRCLRKINPISRFLFYRCLSTLNITLKCYIIVRVLSMLKLWKRFYFSRSINTLFFFKYLKEISTIYFIIICIHSQDWSETFFMKMQNIRTWHTIQFIESLKYSQNWFLSWWREHGNFSHGRLIFYVLPLTTNNKTYYTKRDIYKMCQNFNLIEYTNNITQK